MKPRLKRSSDGRLIVIKPGLNPWREHSAKRFLVEHYGSISAFSERFGFPYNAVCTALRSSTASRWAGNVATVRQVLGLPSTPSKHAIRCAKVRGHV